MRGTTKKRAVKKGNDLKKSSKSSVSRLKTAARGTTAPKGNGKKASTAVKSPSNGGQKGIRKQYLKSSQACNVTFRLPREAATDAQVVTIAGDFNGWNLTDTKMKKLKSGDFKATLKLNCNAEYRFRYIIDGARWENDWCADSYVPNSFGSDDSLVIV